MATGTTPGQDLNLSTERILSNRNFTNKIWNAGKFIEFNFAEMSQADVDRVAEKAAGLPARLSSLPLAEQWVISSLHAMVDQVTDCQV